MKTDSIDSAELAMASSGSVERWVKAGNQLLGFVVVVALACGFGLYQTGHLELHTPSVSQAEPPPLDRGGKVGPMDDAIDGLRKKNWWWMRWFD